MAFTKKTIVMGAIAVGMFVAAGFTANAYSCGGGKATQASTTASKACGVSKTEATMASSGGCASKSSATTASMGCAGRSAVKANMAHAGCGSATSATVASLPEGTKVTRVEVPGGVDLIFTGKDLPGVQAFLASHTASCNEADKASANGRFCNVNMTESNVVLSVRGVNPDECCAGLMTAEATPPAKKAAKVVKAENADKAEKAIAKKS